MEDEIIIKILIKLGVQKNVILNPVSYELLKDKIICLMKQFKILKQPMEELIEENEILDNLERNRVELI